MPSTDHDGPAPVHRLVGRIFNYISKKITSNEVMNPGVVKPLSEGKVKRCGVNEIPKVRKPDIIPGRQP